MTTPLPPTPYPLLPTPYSLPTNFQFSQGSLQDYVDCPRRFQLRYLQRLAWPAIEAQPPLENEHHLRQGVAFHRLAHQHTLGIAPERLASTVADADLRRWWHNYLEHGLEDLPASRHPEVILSAPVGGHRLVAKYDLIAVDSSAMLRAGSGKRAVIVDWKTSRKRPRRRWLAERLQTRVYPYLLVRAGAHLNAGQPPEVGQVEMVYWFANFPKDPARFVYDTARYEADEDYLASLIGEIVGLGDKDLPLTTQNRHCKYCRYRSLCQRGIGAGAFDEIDAELELGAGFDLSLDFEQIAEIEY
ncbi:MAG: PD-(D/E)XK nuclease family protein [Chloroflexota bacterium]|nr:PD-(D/E)XK nuclease family protein [Chloroflexota bacterium]